MFGCSSAACAGGAPLGRTNIFAATKPVAHQMKQTTITEPTAMTRAIPCGRATISQAMSTDGSRISTPRAYGPATRSNCTSGV